MSARRATLVLVLVLVLHGCGLGVGSGHGGSGGDEVPGGDGLGGDVAGTRAPWLVLDLASRTVTAHAGRPGIERGSRIVFHLIPPGTAVVGSGALARQADESERLVALGGFYIAICELTRAQWVALDGSEPWSDLPPVDGSDDGFPALGVSFDAARAMLARTRLADGARLRLPSPDEWEAAARGGSTASFPWGEGDTAAIVGRHAVLLDGGSAGPARVGSLAANGSGLYDVCGNAWELTSDGGIRGGSWADALAAARPANHDSIRSDTRHMAVGLRLVYVP